MPVTIFQPTTSQPFGPGFRVTWETDRIGPEPSGTTWDLKLHAPPTEDQMMHQVLPFTLAQRSIIFVDGFLDQHLVVPVQVGWMTGDTARLTIQLKAPDSTVLEQATVDVELDRVQGQAYELQQYIVTHPAATGTGLSEEQAESLQIVQASVTGVNPIGVIQAGSGLLDELLTASQSQLGQLTDPPMDLTGDGVLELDVVFSFVWGVFFTADVPIGFGKLLGNTLEFTQRLVQFRTVHIIDGTELVTDVLDANYHGYLWKFPTAGWDRVEYSVTPGVVIHAQWWIWP